MFCCRTHVQAAMSVKISSQSFTAVHNFQKQAVDHELLPRTTLANKHSWTRSNIPIGSISIIAPGV
jgi:hypothetical protein